MALEIQCPYTPAQWHNVYLQYTQAHTYTQGQCCHAGYMESNEWCFNDSAFSAWNPAVTCQHYKLKAPYWAPEPLHQHNSCCTASSPPIFFAAVSEFLGTPHGFPPCSGIPFPHAGCLTSSLFFYYSMSLSLSYSDLYHGLTSNHAPVFNLQHLSTFVIHVCQTSKPGHNFHWQDQVFCLFVCFQ